MWNPLIFLRRHFGYLPPHKSTSNSPFRIGSLCKRTLCYRHRSVLDLFCPSRDSSSETYCVRFAVLLFGRDDQPIGDPVMRTYRATYPIYPRPSFAILALHLRLRMIQIVYLEP